MKRLSIKMRVTAWYAGIMLLLAALALVVVLSAGSRYIQSSVRNRLEERVVSSFREIEWDEDDGALDIDDDLYQVWNGVWLGIYDGHGYPLYGGAPGDFPAGVVFENEHMRTARDGENDWYVYDRSLYIPGYGSVWVRGVASQSDSEEAFSTIFYLSLVLFPFMAILAAVGGYMITRRAFRPVSQMTDTARRISGGNDLSQRIGLEGGDDELYQLAKTFDEMLERIQTQFEKEKQFTADASHELRTPISVIISRCEYALEHIEEDGEGRESLQIVLEQARKMARLVSQLLMLSRADSGRAQLQLENVNLSELCEIVVLEQEKAASEKKITIETRIQPDILMKADETMMMRLFINLITNAVIYGREGGHVEVGLSSSDQRVKGYVKDDGIGIPKDQLGRVWDRFYQVNKSRTSENSRGAGLGLSMVKWIVSAHGGSIDVESCPGEGSCFFFEFSR